MMERSEKPVLVITNPKITTIPVGYDSLAVEERYDYSVSHIIYEGIDLGSLEELKKLRADNKSLRGSCKALGEKDNNQRKELIRLNKVIDKLKRDKEELLLQNFNLREDIMIEKKSLPDEEIRDKSFFDLFDMPTYEDLQKEIDELKAEVQEANDNAAWWQSRFNALSKRGE